jgi:hypothetical protein
MGSQKKYTPHTIKNVQAVLARTPKISKFSGFIIVACCYSSLAADLMMWIG